MKCYEAYCNEEAEVGFVKPKNGVILACRKHGNESVTLIAKTGITVRLYELNELEGIMLQHDGHHGNKS